MWVSIIVWYWNGWKIWKVQDCYMTTLLICLMCAFRCAGGFSTKLVAFASTFVVHCGAGLKQMPRDRRGGVIWCAECECGDRGHAWPNDGYWQNFPECFTGVLVFQSSWQSMMKEDATTYVSKPSSQRRNSVDFLRKWWGQNALSSPLWQECASFSWLWLSELFGVKKDLWSLVKNPSSQSCCRSQEHGFSGQP